MIILWSKFTLALLALVQDMCSFRCATETREAADKLSDGSVVCRSRTWTVQPCWSVAPPVPPAQVASCVPSKWRPSPYKGITVHSPLSRLQVGSLFSLSQMPMTSWELALLLWWKARMESMVGSYSLMVNWPMQVHVYIGQSPIKLYAGVSTTAMKTAIKKKDDQRMTSSLQTWVVTSLQSSHGVFWRMT